MLHINYDEEEVVGWLVRISFWQMATTGKYLSVCVCVCVLVSPSQVMTSNGTLTPKVIGSFK